MKTLYCFTLLASLLFSAQRTVAQSLAFKTNNCVVGKTPRCVVAADVNGDGNPDLVSANYDANTLTVLTNNGSGGFGSNATYSVGMAPICVVAADVNNDSASDLIVANFAANSLIVLTNNGSGTFGSNATLAVNPSPYCIAAADVNNDGKSDLIAACCYDASIEVFTNNGSGGFPFSTSYPTADRGDLVIFVAATDINADGYVDLISANLSKTLTLLTNNGSGIFGYNATYRMSYGTPTCVTSADVDGRDGVDLICSTDSNLLIVMTNNGNGVLAGDLVKDVYPVGRNPHFVATGDFNGDGKIDMVSANYAASSLTLLTNNGNGRFGVNTTLSVDAGPWCIAVADVNGDGAMDLITANMVYNTLTVLTQLPASPILNITPTNSNSIVLSWSSSSTNFAVQTNADLTMTNWVSSGYAISTVNGTNQSSIIPLTSGNRFFRLQQ
jgi:hypothetical protein